MINIKNRCILNWNSYFYSDSYLNEKLGNEFNDLVFDKDYLNIYSYMNIPESYKFKYNFKDNTGKERFL